MTTPTRFEDRLLAELREVVATRPAPAAPSPGATTPARRPRRPRRTRRLALGAAAVAAAAAVAVLVASSGDVTTGAYAVQPRDDGSVTVKITSLRDAAGLQRSLRAAGVPADVSYAPANATTCAGSGTAPPATGGERGTSSGGDDDGPSTAVAGRPPAGAPGETAGPGGTAGPGDTATPGHGSVSSSHVRITGDGVTFTVDPGTIAEGQRLVIQTSDGTVGTIAMGVVADGARLPCPGPPPASGR